MTSRVSPGVDDGARTHDTRNHNPMLYQLNYIHRVGTANVRIFSIFPKFFNYNSYLCV